jgi:GNAT superfamily N-acetyltransferase
MTRPGDLPADTGPAVVLADDTCTGVLSSVIADAFFDLEVSKWLIPDETARRQIYPRYFEMYVEHALADGIVLATPDQAAVALWLPADEQPAPAPEGYGERLAAVTGPWVDRFRAFDAELERRHPAGFAHHYLAILAVRPDRQGQGLGTALLRAHHAALDREGIAAYLEASNMRSRRLYRAEGYEDHGGLLFLPGAAMYPMLRPPRPGSQAGQAAPGTLAGSAGPGSAPGGAR